MSAVRVEPLPVPDSAGPPEESVGAVRQEFRCDACGKTFQGLPGGSGLFVWTRGDETRFEEPPLCERCAARITVGALTKWSWEEEEEE